ncbi:peptidase S8/S53 domain-containing protein [Tricharina praecox]|uniref:peptidase S8/S53 domain-containing protein n=1 Tax=Tricharina praecox TaxID=43433 RepID=UPI00221F1467|nr:peptidase S8/S53 domain-containing protein [Tricharina praecox]KAI5858657.1 peptidase S8/S53 domain-containing protein [Tricharina praecox]
MKFLSITLLFVLPFFSGVVVSLEGFGSVPAAVKSHGAPVPDSYIVTFKGLVSSSAVSSHHKWLEGMLAASSAVVGGKVPGVVHKYDIGSFKAYSGVFSKDVVEMLKKQGDVASVVQDQYVSTAAPASVEERTMSDKRSPTFGHIEKRVCKSQTLAQDEAAGEWGLGRISHYKIFSTPMLGWPSYPYDDNVKFCSKLKPSGGVAYVIDSGILLKHPEFQGRAEWGFNARPEQWVDSDICGHGTHVAGIIGGRKYGVQKTAKLIAVKVLEGANSACQGTWGDVIAGLEWTYKHAVANKWLKQSVVNMSLSGPNFPPATEAVEQLVKNGVTIVVSAGNQYDMDACDSSPANAPGAITVGSTDIEDMVSIFSNGGCCVDIYAPGTNIGSSYIGPQYRLMSGTSMAAPFVAAVVLYNKCRLGNDTPAKDLDGIVKDAFSITDQIVDFTGCEDKNKIVYNRATCK